MGTGNTTDVLSLTLQTASQPVNGWVPRQVILPTCNSRFKIIQGPETPTIFASAAIEVPGALSWRLHLKSLAHVDGEVPHYARDAMPLQFQIESGESDERRERTFPVAVFVDKVQKTPNEDQLHWVMYGRGNPSQKSYPRLPYGGVVIWGCFVVCSPKEKHVADGVPKEFRDGKLRDCVILYNSGAVYRGYNSGAVSSLLGVIGKQEEHFPQVVKSQEVFSSLINGKYRDGYFNIKWANGLTGWGKLHSWSYSQQVKARAIQENDGPWKYSKDPEKGWYVPLKGCTYSDTLGSGFEGDVLIGSDGIIRHNYWEQPTGSSETIPCFNHFYPPGSPFVPRVIVESFNSQMTDEYRQALLLESETKVVTV